jgi:hypothetical protein
MLHEIFIGAGLFWAGGIVATSCAMRVDREAFLFPPPLSPEGHSHELYSICKCSSGTLESHDRAWREFPREIAKRPRQINWARAIAFFLSYYIIIPIWISKSLIIRLSCINQIEAIDNSPTEIAAMPNYLELGEDRMN